MKLSMWMLAGWLERYEPRVDIKNGAESIIGVRIITDDLSRLPLEYVYVVRASDSFTDMRYADAFILAHGDDFIFIDGLNLEELLNEVLSAIDYFNTWESDLCVLYSDADGLQKAVDSTCEVFGNPICIGDFEGNVLAVSRRFGPDDVDERWKELLKTGLVTSVYTGPPIYTDSGENVDDWSSTPRRYRLDNDRHYLYANIYSKDELVGGMYIQEHQRRFTPAHMQLANIFCRTLTTALAKRQSEGLLVNTNATAMAELIAGNSVSPDLLNRLINRQNWSPPWQLLITHNYPKSVNELKQRNLLNLVRKIPIPHVSVAIEDGVATAVCTASINDFLKRLRDSIDMRYYCVGVSLPFGDWLNLPICRKQAILAIEHQSGQPGIFQCKDYAFQHLIVAIADHNKELEFIHPSLLTLKQYDSAHHTDLYDTLFQYIAHERNLVETAKALFIHRNSLIYRIRRITELCDADLNSADERTFIFISYLLMRLSDTESGI